MRVKSPGISGIDGLQVNHESTGEPGHAQRHRQRVLGSYPDVSEANKSAYWPQVKDTLTDSVKSVLMNCKFVMDVYIPLLEDIDKSSNKASAKSMIKCLDVLKSMQVNYQAGLSDLARLASRLANGKSGSTAKNSESEKTSSRESEKTRDFEVFKDNLDNASQATILSMGRPVWSHIFSLLFPSVSIDNTPIGATWGSPVKSDIFKRGQILKSKVQSEQSISKQVRMPSAASAIDAMAFMDKRRQPHGRPHKFTDAVVFYSKHYRREFPVSDFPSKIDVSHSGRFIYYAGDTLGCVESFEDQFENLGSIYALQSCTLKVMPSGDVIINDFNNWDLILPDSSFQEKGRVPGSDSGPLPFYKSVFTRSSADSRFLVWLSSRRDISAMDLKTMTVHTISDFWLVSNDSLAEPVALVASNACNKIVGVGEVSMNYQTLHYVDETGPITSYEIKRLLLHGRMNLHQSTP